MTKSKLNFFSDSELDYMKKFQDFRNKLFYPISKLFMKIGLTANFISYIGLFVLSGFIYFIKTDLKLALVFLFLHVFIDAFDGPLARLMNQDGDSGSFTDMICDHTGMVIVVVTLIWANLINPVWASIYLYLYTILIIFIIVRNKLNRPISFVIRTKYFLYTLFGILAFFGMNYLDQGILIFNLLMFPSIFSSYISIKKSL